MCSMQAYFYVGVAESEGLSGICCTHLFQIAENQHRAVRDGERKDGLLEEGSEFAGGGMSFRSV